MGTITHFRINEELLYPDRLCDLERKISENHMRIKDADMLRIIVRLRSERKIDYKTAVKEIRSLLEFLPIEEQVERCLFAEPLSDGAQRMLAFIYNTVTGCYFYSETYREMSYSLGHCNITINSKYLKNVFGTDDDGEIHQICEESWGLFRLINIENEDGSFSANGILHFSMVRKDDRDNYDLIIGFSRLMLVLMPKYINRLVKPEYIRTISVEQAITEYFKFYNYEKQQ